MTKKYVLKVYDQFNFLGYFVIFDSEHKVRLSDEIANAELFYWDNAHLEDVCASIAEEFGDDSCFVEVVTVYTNKQGRLG